MLAKILGALDLLSAITIILLRFNLAKGLAIILAIYVIGKGVFFISDKTSIVDIIGGIVIMCAVFYGFHGIMWLFVFWFAQKGLLSLLMTT